MWKRRAFVTKSSKVSYNLAQRMDMFMTPRKNYCCNILGFTGLKVMKQMNCADCFTACNSS